MNELASYNTKSIIEEKFSNISIFPKSGTFIFSVLDNISEEFSNVQRRIAKSYVILYRHYEDSDIAYISHIFHQMQDYTKIFQN